VLEEELVRLLPKVLREHPELRQEVLSILTGSYLTSSPLLKEARFSAPLTPDFCKMSEFTGKSVKPIVAGVRFDRHALEEAKRLGVEVVYI
jgi:hypothetical protein